MKLLGVVAFLLHALSCLAFSPRAGGSLSKDVPGSPPRVVRATTIDRPLPRTHLLRASSSPFDFLQSIVTSSSKSPATKEPPRPRIPDVVVDSDYTLAAAFAVVGVSIIAADRGGVGGVLGGGFFALLASLFAVQASRIRFVFDETCFELKTVDSIGSDDLRDSGENIVVGGGQPLGLRVVRELGFLPESGLPGTRILQGDPDAQARRERQRSNPFFPRDCELQTAERTGKRSFGLPLLFTCAMLAPIEFHHSSSLS